MKLKITKIPVNFPQRVKNIEFKNVSFSYDERNTIIQDLSFSMPEGTTTALVGATGAGKSTTANLLLRYYNLTGGQISIGNENLEQIDLTSLRQNIGLVSQDPFLFDATVKKTTFSKSNG